jgi:oligopeptide transport system substrate-binding protein
VLFFRQISQTVGRTSFQDRPYLFPKSKPYLLVQVCVIAAAFSACVCAAATVQPVPTPSTRIVIHLPKEPATLDWNLSSRRIDYLVIQNLQEGLVEIGPKHQPLPVLAKSWDISPDGMTYTFHLRKDVVWSDGKPLIAKHFVDSWKRLLSPITATSNSYFLLDVNGAGIYHKGREPDFSTVGIKALDDYTIQVKLGRPLWNWIWNFAEPYAFPIREDLIDLHGAKFWTAPGNLVTLGPYLLVSHDLDSGFVLRKNPRYVKAPQLSTGNVTEIEFKIEPNADAVQALLNGKLDLVCYLSGVDEISAQAKKFLRWSEPNNTKRLDFNVKRFPFSSPDIRQAIGLAIDRKKVSVEVGPSATVATSLSPNSMSTHLKSVSAPYDLTKARALLKSAQLEQLTVDILVPMFDEHATQNLKAAQAIQAMLETGLHAGVTLQQANTEQLYSLLRDTQQFSLLMRDWTGTNDPDEFYSFYASFSKKSTNWSSVKYDKLVQDSRVVKSDGERMKLYREMDQTLVQKEFAILPLFYSADAMLVGPRISGFNSERADPCRVRALSVK